MSAAYTTLATTIGLLILFLYLSWLYVSAKFVWIKDNDNWFYENVLKQYAEIIHFRDWSNYFGIEDVSSTTREQGGSSEKGISAKDLKDWQRYCEEDND